MMDITTSFSTIQKLAPRTLLALGIASAAVLFLPTEYVQRFRMERLRAEYGVWTGLTCLVSWSLVTTHFLWWTSRTLKTKNADRRATKEAMEHLHVLTPDERGFLLPYVYGETTRYVMTGDGVAGGLAAKRIVYISSNMFPIHKVPYNIHPWALGYLYKHQQLLKAATNYPPPSRRDMLDALM